jgi:cytochrome bd-type quinol oxidase subunit 2
MPADRSRQIQTSALLTRVAMIGTAAVYIAAFLAIASTPEGDKDSHSHIALAILVYGSSVALLASFVALVSARVAGIGLRAPLLTALIALAPIAFVAALLAGWL